MLLCRRDSHWIVLLACLSGATAVLSISESADENHRYILKNQLLNHSDEKPHEEITVKINTDDNKDNSLGYKNDFYQRHI